MLQILDNTYIAALEGDEVIFKSTSKQEFEKATDPTKYEGKTEEGIDIISPYSESIWDFDNSSPQINDNRYTDIKENHYKEFVANYETFLNEFTRYSEKWLSYSLEIEKTFSNGLDLPPYEGDIGKPFINPKKLAVYTIGRIMGINPIEVFVQEQEYVMVQGPGLGHNDRVVLKGTPKETKKCVDIIRRLLENDKKYDGLHPQQEPLLLSAKKLRSDLDKIIKSYKLPENCEYI